MSTKFEQLLDLLVNEEMDKANELFHEIVVEKSRDIYENLIAEEEQTDMEEAEEDQDESVEEADDDQDESVEENMDLEDSYSMEADDEDHDSFDTTDNDATGTLGQKVGDMDDEEPAGEEAAIMDIKTAIAELEAAFAELEQAKGMGSDEMSFGGDSDKPKMDMPSDDSETDEMMGFAEGRRITREYREMVKDGHGAEKKGATEGGIAGANTGEKMPSGTNTKSAINANADRTKPTSGARPISSKDGSVGSNTGTSPNAKTDSSSLAGSVKGEFTKGVEKNISSSSKSSMKDGAALSKQGSGYPGNNKTAGPVGSGSGDKAGQTSVSSDKPFLKHL